MTDAPKALSDAALRFIVQLHSGEATRADHAAFAAWRQQSAAHETAAREAEAIWGDSAELHEDAGTKTVQPGGPEKRKNAPKGRGGKLLGLALLVAGAGAGLWAANGGLVRWSADEATGIAETRDIALADGSHVLLNARSAIDIAFSGKERRVVLRDGEAFFDVRPDAKRPFMVEAGGASIRALGTAFDVDHVTREETIVAVADHAVRLTAASGAIDLAAGQQTRVDAAGRIAPIRDVQPAAIGAWREGLFIAEDQPLGDIVAALRAYHRGWIILRDARLAALRVNAVLDLKTPEASLKTLARGLPIGVTQITPFLIVIGHR